MNQIHPEPLSGTLVDILEETAARYPEHGIFHVASGDTSEEFQSYPELLRNAKEMAQVLYRRGLRPRTPLILSVDASRTFLEIFWGCLFSGVLPAPLAHMRTPKADSMEAQKIFHVWEAIKAPIVADSSNERAFAVLTDMFKGTGATLIASEDLITEARIVDFQEDDRYIPQHDDSAVLQFSSGSTGMPKGARLKHRNLIANIRALRAIEGGTSEDRLVTWLPYFHDFGLFGCHLMPMLAGMDQIKMDPFQFAQRPFLWMEKIHEHRGTITSATNTGIEHLSAYIGLRADRLPEVDLSCLKVWTVGAEMISAESCRILQEQLAPMGLAPHLLMPGYGLTETTLVATCHPRNTPVKTFTLDRRLMVSEQVVRYVPKGEDAAEFTSVGKPVQYCGQGRQAPARRPCGRGGNPGGQRHLRLFRQSRSDRVLVQRGVVLHRGHGLHGRRGRPVHRGPFQGNHHRARAELLSRRHRAHRPVRHGKGVPARGGVRRVRSPGRPRDHPDVLHPGEKGR